VKVKVLGLGAKPEKLKAFCFIAIFLYFLSGIVEIQHLDFMFTVPVGDAPQ